MRYLILTADYTSFLKDEFDKEFNYLDLNLSADLIEKLKDWHEDYLPIIQLSNAERWRMNTEIIELDERGIDLAKEIEFQSEKVKIKYYSEGLLMFMVVGQR